jgi:hypothetical protein
MSVQEAADERSTVPTHATMTTLCLPAMGDLPKRTPRYWRRGIFVRP